MMVEAQVKVEMGDWSWIAHGRGRRSAISRSKSRNRIATEEEADGEWKAGGAERVEATLIG